MHFRSLVFLILFCCLSTGWVDAQPPVWPTAAAHSHNDYLQGLPLAKAYGQNFGSVEADVFFLGDSLHVAHTQQEIRAGQTLDHLYLKPLMALVKKNGGTVYPDAKRTLQLLIDLKTPYETTLSKLIEELSPYRKMLYPGGTIKVVISGNTPPPSEFNKYPDFISFDGRPETSYSKEQLKRIGLISQSFRKYSKWDGTTQLPDSDREKLRTVVDGVHRQGKPFRFWANPDRIEGWKMLQELNVDYLNTDKIDELATFLKNNQPPKR
jgi:alkaline phosphatase